MCRIYLYILWTCYWPRSLMSQLKTDDLRKNLHWYHYYVIVDLYFHFYFQQSREREKAIPKDKRWIPYTVLAYIRLSDSAQSFMVYRTNPLKVKKCKNDMFHTLVCSILQKVSLYISSQRLNFFVLFQPNVDVAILLC